MTIDLQRSLQRVSAVGNNWQRWRARSLMGDDSGPMPAIPYQDDEGGFSGPGGRLSPGATGEALCHLVILGVADSGAAVVAGDWLEGARTPAGAWLDAPDEVPGDLDTPAGSRVWATASAATALLAVARHPGPRALDLLRGEADLDGRFTGGAYPTCAAAAAYWLAEGPKTEMGEWGLKWARESSEELWGPWERATALTFWGAAGIPAEHATVDSFAELLKSDAPQEGWVNDLGLTLRTLEVLEHFQT